MSSAWTIVTVEIFSLAMVKHPRGKVLYCLYIWKIIFNYIDFSEDIGDITSTVTQYSWLAKSDQNKNDWKFAYFNLRSLHIYARFHPETQEKLEYKDNCSSLKEIRVSTLAEIHLWVKDLTRSKELRPTTCTSDFVRVSKNDINVCKRYLPYKC